MYRSARTLAIVVTMLVPAPALAQVVAGQVVEPGTRAPSARSRVRLMRHGAFPQPVLVDSTRTDERGFFQFLAPYPGVYQLEFGPRGPYAVRGPIDTLAADAEVQRMYEVPSTVPGSLVPYFEFQVETPVKPLGKAFGFAPYPVELREQNIEGDVLVQFVVDTLGRAEMETFRVLRATHPGFVMTVRQSVTDLRFKPARLDDRPVRQLVQQPFEFRLQRGAAPLRQP